jgi:hypothetical protein
MKITQIGPLYLLLVFLLLPSSIDAKSRRQKTDTMWKNRKRECEREDDLCRQMHPDMVSAQRLQQQEVFNAAAE